MCPRVLKWSSTKLLEGHKVALATVISATGSVPGKPGARIAITEHGEKFGTVGGAGLEFMVLKKLDHLIKHENAGGIVETFALNKSAKGFEVVALDSLCGGKVTISMEVVLPMPHILLFGGGHVAKAIISITEQIGWNYSIHDSRKQFSNKLDFPNGIELHCNSVKEFLKNENQQSLQRFSDLLLLGHDWKEDEERLIGLLKIMSETKKINPRIGVIGSKSKWKNFEKKALEQNIKQELIDQVICPIGLNIGAQSPEEIAIAVCGQIISLIKEKDPNEGNWRTQSN
ncbi:MAG: hypothetical protein CMB56_001815 [Methanobacteriota archaeon]|nr:MAG: hypothetical protein CMB56_001815 [Euryarchaeota archaeon]|tara:strand:- start:12890 stop:13747 length:858 start_codon:yes stop_codon:yes gene_type:complete